MVDKSLGQHWLYNRAVLEEIASLACVEGAQSVCVEIGPGLGTLTAKLLKRFKKVIAVEFDPKLAANLPGSFPGTNLEVVQGDILKFDFSTISEPYVVAGNIPYYITSPIIEKLLTAENLPSRIVLLMQKEVAERVCSDKESVLSLFVKNRATASLGSVVPREEFRPAPKVDSQVLILEPFSDGAKYPPEVMELIKRAFKNPRKKLKHNLPNVPLEYADLRPENLHLDDYCAIIKTC